MRRRIREYSAATWDRKEGDLVWIGNWGDDERTAELHEFLLEPVKRLGLKARVYGVCGCCHCRFVRSPGVEVGEWVTSTTAGLCAFYDIDTPVTLVKIEKGDTEYISKELVRRYHMYLSFTGGFTLERVKQALRLSHGQGLVFFSGSEPVLRGEPA